MVVHSVLRMDPRVQREARALLSAGWAVDIICLRDANESRYGVWEGARVHRIPVRRHRGSGLAVYLVEYLAFFALATLLLSWLGLRRRYDLVQAHNVPDFLVFTALVPRLRGARIVLDVRDPLPDLYASKSGGRQAQMVSLCARLTEAASVRWSHHVLTPGEPSRRRLVGRGAPEAKVTNILNSADPALFPSCRGARLQHTPERGFVVVYHGGLFARYGLDIAIRAMRQARETIPDLQFRIAGYGEEQKNLQQLVDELGLCSVVKFVGWVAPARIAEFAADADLGIAPYRLDSFTELIYPTKAFEYMAMGVPVVMSDLSGMRELFPAVPDLFVQPGDVDALAERITALYRDPARLRRLNEDATCAYAAYSWQAQRQKYLSLISGLVERNCSAGQLHAR